MGDFFETHLFQIITLATVIVFGLMSYAELKLSQRTTAANLADLEKLVEDLAKQFAAHLKDQDAHVNHLYMQALKERIVNMEASMKSGFEKVSDKIDKLSEKIHEK